MSIFFFFTICVYICECVCVSVCACLYWQVFVRLNKDPETGSKILISKPQGTMTIFSCSHSVVIFINSYRSLSEWVNQFTLIQKIQKPIPAHTPFFVSSLWKEANILNNVEMWATVLLALGLQEEEKKIWKGECQEDNPWLIFRRQHTHMAYLLLFYIFANLWLI